MKTPSVVAFELATVPDADGARRLQDLGDLDDANVVRALGQRRLQDGCDERLPPHLRRIAAVGVVHRDRDGLEARALGGPDECESGLIACLFELLGRDNAVPVSWNADGTDMAVIAHRALLHGAGAAPGDDWADRYLALAAALGGRHAAPREELVEMLDLPRRRHPAARPWDDFRARRPSVVRDDSVTAAVSTYLLYLRYLRLHGCLDADALHGETELVRNALAGSDYTASQRTVP